MFAFTGMRRLHLAYVGVVALLLIVATGSWWVFRAQPTGMAIGVRGYRPTTNELHAFLLLTNTGAVSVAVPLRLECDVRGESGLTNYAVNTPYTIFLGPGAWTVLSNQLWVVPLPPDATAWRVKAKFRRMSTRERLAEAVRQSGVVNIRTLSRVLGRPGDEADFDWHECDSGWLNGPPRDLVKEPASRSAN